MKFITAHKHQWGVEPICRVLQVAPSSYYAAVSRPVSERRRRDADLKVAIRRIWDDHRRVYGADKVWAQLNREGTRVARCTVERLMRELGLRGVVRDRTSVRTTVSDEASARPADLVARHFRALAPNRLWVADLTYVKTYSGWVVAFIVDAFSRFVVGWQASRSLRTNLAGAIRTGVVQAQIPESASDKACCSWSRRRRGRAGRSDCRSGRIGGVSLPNDNNYAETDCDLLYYFASLNHEPTYSEQVHDGIGKPWRWLSSQVVMKWRSDRAVELENNKGNRMQADKQFRAAVRSYPPDRHCTYCLYTTTADHYSEQRPKSKALCC